MREFPWCPIGNRAEKHIAGRFGFSDLKYSNYEVLQLFGFISRQFASISILFTYSDTCQALYSFFSDKIIQRKCMNDRIYLITLNLFWSLLRLDYAKTLNQIFLPETWPHHVVFKNFRNRSAADHIRGTVQETLLSESPHYRCQVDCCAEDWLCRIQNSRRG